MTPLATEFCSEARGAEGGGHGVGLGSGGLEVAGWGVGWEFRVQGVRVKVSGLVATV